MPAPWWPRARALLHWIFLKPGKRHIDRRELLIGSSILVSVAVLNTALQESGAYERLDWSDLDRLQQSAQPTGREVITLVQIGDDDYETLFHARSPLEPEGVIALVAGICRHRPRAVGVDLITADWDPALYPASAAQRLERCPVVWITDVKAAAPDSSSLTRPPMVTLGNVLGTGAAPPNVCSAAPIFQPDADGVVRRYTETVPGVTSDAADAAVLRDYPTFVTAIARVASDSGCPLPVARRSQDHTEAPRIRFSSNTAFPRLPARYLTEAQTARGGNELYGRSVDAFVRDRIVIVGGTYRHSRDVHRTSIGVIPGSDLVASALHTVLTAPIEPVHWWQSLAIDVVVGFAMLVGLMWSGLRWPWATLASFVLSATVAIIVSWHLHKYLGYFLGVLGGLMGVVLAELTSVLWEPMREMWRGWLGEFPAPLASPSSAVGVRNTPTPESEP